VKKESVDWEEYNEPPFLPQWMCEDETLLMARFDDDLNRDIESHIRGMVDQHDIDHIKGIWLDRIGKILDEARDGDTDDFYRIRLKVKKLLNTSNGSVNDIIKIAKVLYSSEDVHVVANYPAGIKILHDGEGTPGIDFNKILRAVVAAGVAYNTTELFNFIDELFSTDSQLVTVRHRPKEEFEGRIYHNRRILRNGNTVLPTELKKAYHSGVNYHNGITRHNGRYETEAASYIVAP
jgi:hypothetical protein